MYGKKILPFRPMQLTDRPWVIERFAKSDFRGCEYSFGNNFIWRNLYNLEVLDYRGFLIIKTRYRGVSQYGFPAGEGNLKEVIEALIMDACCRNEVFSMRGVTEANIEIINNYFPDCFDYSSDRGDSDYVYLTEKLISLSGKKLQSKRNHIARFKDNPDWAYEPITRENINECYEFNKCWCEENGCLEDEELKNEYCAVVQSFTHFFDLGFSGGLLRRNGEVIAFSMGEPLNSDTYVVHIEKAYHHIQGAYPMINQQFLIHNCQEYKYVNREEDTNDEGLRKAKLSYNPEIILTKYKLSLKEQVAYDNSCQTGNDCRTERDIEKILR